MRWQIRLMWMSCCLLAGSAAAGTLPEYARDLAARLTAHYGTLAQSPISSGILYDLALPISHIERFDGSDTAAVASRGDWLQIAHELHRASLGELALPSQTEFRALSRHYAKLRVYPVVIQDYRLHRARPGLASEDIWVTENGEIVSVREDALIEQEVTAAAALNEWTYRGARVSFQFNMNAFYFSNDPLTVTRIEADFNDGLGMRAVNPSGATDVRYHEAGRKTIHLRIQKSDGVWRHARFGFDVRSLDAPDPTITWTMAASLPYQGVYAAGDAYLYLSDQHTALTNPVVVAEGIDLDNSMNWDELYDLLNQENLIETMREMGYDAVVLNFAESTLPIQANAMLLAALLDSVRNVVGSERTWPLIGASMGGLVTRYALSYMETNALPHSVSTLLTFDSPHRGANIPLGIQYWVDFFADQSADAAFLRDALNSAAARQMLVSHFTSPASGTAQPDPLFTAFQSELAQLGGYPAQPRLVAVANGSGALQGAGFSPGAQLIRYEYRSFLLDITGNVWALHNTQSQRIFQGEINLIWPLPDEYLNVTVSPTWSWDNAPGGARPTMLEMDSVEAPNGDIIALYSSHCFIPTISSLDLAVSDPFFDIAGAPDLYALTPFDTLYFPAVNQDHITVTPEGYGWFVQEVCGGLRAPTVVVTWDSQAVNLVWDSILGARSYRV
ncbi:MAG: hypothetical protein PHI18_09665, partial [bacterium]|nr:hypothetical protein [bacterium]